jgi:hypothetical protein
MTSFIGKRNLIKVKAIWTLMYADERRHLQMESAFVSVPNMLSGLPMNPAASQVYGEVAEENRERRETLPASATSAFHALHSNMAWRIVSFHIWN